MKAKKTKFYQIINEDDKIKAMYTIRNIAVAYDCTDYYFPCLLIDYADDYVIIYDSFRLKVKMLKIKYGKNNITFRYNNRTHKLSNYLKF